MKSIRKFSEFNLLEAKGDIKKYKRSYIKNLTDEIEDYFLYNIENNGWDIDIIYYNKQYDNEIVINGTVKQQEGIKNEIIKIIHHIESSIDKNKGLICKDYRITTTEKTFKNRISITETNFQILFNFKYHMVKYPTFDEEYNRISSEFLQPRIEFKQKVKNGEVFGRVKLKNAWKGFEGKVDNFTGKSIRIKDPKTNEVIFNDNHISKNSYSEFELFDSEGNKIENPFF